MANYVVSDTSLTAVADAIREKTGKSAQMAFPDGFVDEIGDISGGGSGLDWADVTEITIGANTVRNTSDVSAYFSNYTYNYLILTTAPTTENQIVVGARLAQSGAMNHVLRYRGGSIGGAIIQGSYDGVLVEGTKYCLLSLK